MEDAALLKYTEGVPRYTSYPTALQFAEDVGPEEYRQWLGRLDPAAPLSLYLHIPFCSSLCWFCGCQTTVVNNYEPIAGYLDLLAQEIEMVADALGGGHRAAHVHWGGGTPTLTTGPDFQRVMALLATHFDISGNTEVAVEIDPRTISEDTVAAMAKAGVNRVSIGVQDVSDRVQLAINRVQPFEVVENAVALLRANGISSISFDIMYGLPYQTPETMIEGMDRVLRLDPDRVSLFGYGHVPRMRPHQNLMDVDALPDPSDRLELYRAAAKRLSVRGYVPVGLDHFAKTNDPMAAAATTGELHRNFQGYTTDTAGALIGFGASAIGSLPQGYIQNAPTVPAWRKAISAGSFATVRGFRLGDDDRLRRAVIERLMCDLTVNLDQVCAEFGTDADQFADSLLALKPLEADGAAEISGNTVTVPKSARLAVRSACLAFDAYAT
ncbi:MAG: oxygen-independent coproporphyrinogen III oxidase [Alphaproteobacteria bacterium]|mgnify:CR=1 FL=1|nr:oxygen-independent coproporphyrinogen III oxidase [Alphaproteobacteria bacterium]MBT5859606.1 oxygen-independent coproporphyrinogen III oxidase [Alphaproteobacteria bacterium]